MLLLIELARARHKAELEDTARRALIDAVTGLPNKMAFQRDVDAALAIESAEVIFFSMDIQVPNQLIVLNKMMLHDDLERAVRGSRLRLHLGASVSRLMSKCGMCALREWFGP